MESLNNFVQHSLTGKNSESICENMERIMTAEDDQDIDNISITSGCSEDINPSAGTLKSSDVLVSKSVTTADGQPALIHASINNNQILKSQSSVPAVSEAMETKKKDIDAQMVITDTVMDKQQLIPQSRTCGVNNTRSSGVSNTLSSAYSVESLLANTFGANKSSDGHFQARIGRSTDQRHMGKSTIKRITVVWLTIQQWTFWYKFMWKSHVGVYVIS